MKKRLISMLLAVLMVVSLFSGLSVGAYADNATYNTIRYTLVQGDYVLRICQRLGLNFYVCKDAIMRLNNITENQWRFLAVGREILLPASDMDAVAFLSGKPAASTTATTTPLTTTTIPTTTTTTTTAGYNDVLSHYLVPYTMGSGETVLGVCGVMGLTGSAYLGVFRDIIREVNGLKDNNTVRAGSTYLFPTLNKPAVGTACKAVYVHYMLPGETAYSVCNNVGISYSQNADLLRALNYTKNLNKLKAGQTLFYPIDIVVAPESSGSGSSGSSSSSSGSSSSSTAKVYKLAAEMNSVDGTMAFYVDNKPVTSAKAGDKVHVVVTTNDGKAVKKLTVKHADGKADLLLTGDTFIMPETDIRVVADIESGYAITLETNYTGKAVATVGGLGVTSASRDSKVIIVSTDPTYEIESVTAYYRTMLGAKKDLAITNNGFAMPEAAVTVSVTLKPVTTYDFYVTTVGSGSFFLSVNGGQVNKAAKGTEVKIVTQPLEGYAVTGWKVTKHDDSSVSVSVFNNTFIMPAFDVDIEVTFGEKGNNIVFMPAKGGSAHAEVSGKTVTEANTGETVELKDEPLDAYEIDHWTVVRNKDGYKVTVEDDGSGNYSFKMPAGGVTVTPVFIGKKSVAVKVDLFLDDVKVTSKDLLLSAAVSVSGPSAATTYKVNADVSNTSVLSPDDANPYSGDYVSVAYSCPANIAFEKVMIVDGSDKTIAEYANQLKTHDFFELDAELGTSVVIKVFFSRGKIALPKAAVKGVGSVSYASGVDAQSIGSAKAHDDVIVILSPGDHYMFDYSTDAFDGTFSKYLHITRKDNGAEIPLTEWDKNSDGEIDGYIFTMPDCGVDVQAEFLSEKFTILMMCTDITDPNNPIDVSHTGLYQIKVGEEEAIADNLISIHKADLNDVVIASMTDAGKSKYDMVSFSINGYDYTAGFNNYAYNFKIADLRAMSPNILIEAKLKARGVAKQPIGTYFDASKGNVECILYKSNSPYSAAEEYGISGAYVKAAYPGDVVGILVAPTATSYNPKVTVSGGDATVINPGELYGSDHGIDINGDGSADGKDILYTFIMPNTSAGVTVVFQAVPYTVTFDLASSTMPDGAGGTKAVDYNLLKASIDGATYRDINSDTFTFPDAKTGSTVNVVRTEYCKAQGLKIAEMFVQDAASNLISVKSIYDGFSFVMPSDDVLVTFVLVEDATLKTFMLNQTAAHLSIDKYKDGSDNLITSAHPGDTVYIYLADVTPEKGYVNAGANDGELLKVYEPGYKTNIATYDTTKKCWIFTMPNGGYVLESNVKILNYTLTFKISGGSGSVNVSVGGGAIKKVVDGEKLIVKYNDLLYVTLVPDSGDKSLALSATSGTVSGNSYRANALADEDLNITLS